VPILPATFVTGTSLSYPVPTPREHPPQGTRYRVRANMRYAGRIATLDRTVEFGARQAKLSEAFSGHKTPSGGGTPWAAIVIPTLAVVAAIAGVAGVRHQRDGVRRDATVFLQRALAGAEPQSPVSVILVGGSAAAGVAPLMRRRMRPTDRLVETPDGSLALVATDTGAVTAAGLAQDLRGALEREAGPSGTAPSVGAATAERPESPADVLSRARADRRSHARP
jgi:hypothetical protein